MLVMLLLLTFYGATEAATVTLTEAGWGAHNYPWPAPQMIRISIDCITSQPYVMLFISLEGGDVGDDGVRINWFPDDIMLQIYCPNAARVTKVYPFTPDCSGGGNVTYTVQWTIEEIRVVHQGVLVAVRQRDSGCVARPDKWRLFLDKAIRVTAYTDEG